MATTVPQPMAPSTANWHWKNKTVTSWAKQWFDRELTSVRVSGDGSEEVLVSRVVEVDGDVELGQRKSKLITIYDCKVILNWSGTASDGTAVEGKVTIPEVSHENTLDGTSDYVYEWSLTTAQSPAVDTLFQLAKSRLPAALEAKFSTFPAAIVETHGKDLTVSTDPSRQSTPAPAAAPSGSAPSSVPAKKADAPPAAKAKAEKVNTTDLTVEARFMVSAKDLFSILTDEKSIPNWTRAPATGTAEQGKEWSMLGGSISGKYVSVDAPTRFVQTWKLASPTWPSDHYATFTTTLEQDNDSTQVVWNMSGVPIGLKDEIKHNIEGYYVHGLKSIGYVQVYSYIPPPQKKRIPVDADTKRMQASKSHNTASNARLALGFACLALVAAFAFPYLYSRP